MALITHLYRYWNIPNYIPKRKDYYYDRKLICDWIMINGKGGNSTTENNTNTSEIKMPFCGHGDQCPTLGQSKYGWHVQGDTYGSQRLMDTLLSATIPIFTRIQQYNVTIPFINWNKLSYFINLNQYNIDDQLQQQQNRRRRKRRKKKILHLVSNSSNSSSNSKQQQHQASFLNSIQILLKDTKGYAQRRSAILRHRKLFDWTTIHPFDVYMYMIQTYYYPETTALSSSTTTSTTSSSHHNHYHHSWDALQLDWGIQERLRRQQQQQNEKH